MVALARQISTPMPLVQFFNLPEEALFNLLRCSTDTKLTREDTYEVYIAETDELLMSRANGQTVMHCQEPYNKLYGVVGS